ncbi:nitroreductase family deazaflavin-dependent oxidoreductase [Nocardiopsis composta]|uniref:Deazaflavin-dependent oxidoreductase (Nitroreductase family) n=1 Tax=Nocardiopsis composta TaxID=157465 RepID=A0A7W8QN91_9ACTN|nr:nitroreductase family deazaflavin-dependent oxidoreductase [Nocardiopsis composta]MBB5433396.1 deazaflavin-dependent oxidoreductase (nitroreductase family) [Nocardiopsis composta]
MNEVRRCRPNGLERHRHRLPVHLYRWRLGWLLGGRFLLLAHVARRSGRVLRTVVEVVEHDPASGAYVVCSGFGERADWYRNLRVRPRASVLVGLRRFQAEACFPDPDEGAALMARYAERHPRAAGAPAGCAAAGAAVPAEEYRRLGRCLPFVRLVPCPD